MRRLLVIATMSLASTVLCAPTVARADVVVLKSGAEIEGEVTDAGDAIIVEGPIGSQRIPKSEIARIEVDEDEPVPARGADEVVLLDGSVVRGDARLSEDRSRVIVDREFGTLSLERERVREIRWADGSSEDAEEAPSIRVRVEDIVGRLESEDEEVRGEALQELRELGLFAIPYVEEIRDEAPTDVRRVIDGILRRHRLRARIHPEILSRIPDIVDRLTGDTSPSERVQALEDAVVASPDGATPLLVHLVEDPEQPPELKSFAVGHLDNLGRVQALLEILDREDAARPGDGPALLSAAIALARHDVLVGIPVLISALRHPEADVRALAREKLEEVTEEFHGFPPEGDPEERQAAIARWEEWWTENEEDLTERSRAALDPSTTSVEDMEEAMDLWRRASDLWARLDEVDDRDFELEKVHYFLDQALEIYPGFSSARIGLAVLLYTELGRPGEAREHLRVFLDRYADDAGPLVVRHARYHLGRVSTILEQWSEAQANLGQVLDGDEEFVDARIALGDLHVRRSRAAGLVPEERRSHLESAIEEFRRAATVLEEIRRRFGRSQADYVVVHRARAFQGGEFRQSMREAVAMTTRDLARIRFRIGRAFMALHRRSDALTELRAATELDPEREAYARALELCRSAMGADELEDRVEELPEGSLPDPASTSEEEEEEIAEMAGPLAAVIRAERSVLRIYRRVRDEDVEDPAGTVEEELTATLETAVRELSAPGPELSRGLIDASLEGALQVEQIREQVGRELEEGSTEPVDVLGQAATVLREVERSLRAAGDSTEETAAADDDETPESSGNDGSEEAAPAEDSAG